MTPVRPSLLVSVRSVAEAEAALAGGAALIDVKEPSRGALGRADAATIAAVIAAVAGRRPISAAIGELIDAEPPFALPGLAFAKWGLAGLASRPDWPARLRQAMGRLPHGCRGVAVAYADHARADAPPVDEVIRVAIDSSCAALLIDTWRKDGSTLLDWLEPPRFAAAIRQCRAAGIRVALAGSLGMKQIEELRTLSPDWFAVRGAACREGHRGSMVEEERVRGLVDAIIGRASGGLEHP